MLSTVYSPELSPDVAEAKHSISPEHSLPLLVLLFLSVISWKPNLALTQLLLLSSPCHPPPLLSHSQLVIKFFTCFVMTLRFLPSFLPSLHCHHSNLGPWGFIPGTGWATLLCFLSYQFMLHSLSLSHWTWRYLNLSSSRSWANLQNY